MSYPMNNNAYTGYGYGQPPQPIPQNTNRQNLLTIDLINGGGLQAANASYVAPGVTSILIDFPANVFYIKSCDDRGIPQPMRICDFRERVQQQPVQQSNDQTASLQNQIDELKSLILSMNQQNQNGAPPQNNQPRNQKKGGNQ